jgi:hypothetical protein
MPKKIILSVAVILILLALTAGLGAYYLLATRTGAENVFQRLLDRYAGVGTYSWKALEGDLLQGVVIKDLELRGVAWLPEQGVVRIQELKLHSRAFELAGIEAEFTNARFLLAKDDPLVADGRFHNGRLEANIYTRAFNLARLRELFPAFKSSAYMSGDLRDIDANFSGNLKDFQVKGRAKVVHWVYGRYILAESPVVGDLRIARGASGTWQIFGDLDVSGGDFLTPDVKTRILPSRFHFNGDPQQPTFHLQGKAKVQRVKIDIDVKGTREKPQLSLSSDPSYPQQLLLVMLMTGKSWGNPAETGFGQASQDFAPPLLKRNAIPSPGVPPELASGFVDYFLFGGTGQKFAEYFGLSGISLKLDNTSRGLKFNKEVSNRLGLGYGIETLDPNSQIQRYRQYKQTVEGQLELSDKISIDLERALTTTSAPNSTTSPEAPRLDDKVYLKYRTRF